MELISRIKWYIVGIGAVGVLFIVSQMYLALQERKTAEQQQKIVQWQSQNPKVVFKEKQSTVIERKTDTKRNVAIEIRCDKLERKEDGSLIVSGEVFYSERTLTDTTEKENQKQTTTTNETKTPVYTTLDPARIYLGGITGTRLDYVGAQITITTGQFIFHGAYTTRPEGIIGAGIKVLEIK